LIVSVYIYYLKPVSKNYVF